MKLNIEGLLGSLVSNLVSRIQNDKVDCKYKKGFIFIKPNIGGPVVSENFWVLDFCESPHRNSINYAVQSKRTVNWLFWRKWVYYIIRILKRFCFQVRLKFWKKCISFFITEMKRTKRPTELKIVFKKKTLINKKFGNACEYVTVKDLGELFRGKYFGTWATLQKWTFFDKLSFCPFLSFNRNEVNGFFFFGWQNSHKLENQFSQAVSMTLSNNCNVSRNPTKSS